MLIWLPDSPVHARFLTKEERIAALERVRNDQGGTVNKQFKKEQVRQLYSAIIASTFSNYYYLLFFQGLGGFD